MDETSSKKTSFKKSVRDEVKSQRLGDILRKAGQITKFQLDEALAHQKKNKGRLGHILVTLGFIDEESIVNFIARQQHVPIINIRETEIADNIIALIPCETAKENFICPIALTADGALSVASTDPTNLRAQEELANLTKKTIQMGITTESDMGYAFKKYYKIDDKEYNLLFSVTKVEEEKVEIEEVDDLGALLSDVVDDIVEIEDDTQKDETGGPAANDAPIIKLVNEILNKAIKNGISDIHIEPFEKVFYVRYRKDGALFKAMNLPLEIKNAVISRIKIMSNLNIAERRVPQDGRIKLKIGGGTKSIDFRVSVLPTLWGESIVMRILNPDSLMLDFTKLGFSQDALIKFNNAIAQPQGMIIITGPTGSGKTNTLYSAINKLNEPDVKILMAEDPIEFNFPGINQVLVRSEVGMTYAAALKAFLRQDPEIILVGETRDMETAEICIKAAMTGHLVFTTLHTNDCPATIGRLVDIGIPSYMLASAINLILAQRLLRRICPKCKVPLTPLPEPAKLLEMGFMEKELDDLEGKVMVGKGCPTCNGTGYKGRVGVYEIMEVGEELKKAIAANVAEDVMRKIAIKEGMSTLRRDALQKVKDGITTLRQVEENTVITKESLPAYLLNPNELIFEDNDLVIQEGNTDKNFYQLIQGHLLVSKNGILVGDISQPEEYFGEMSALMNEPRTATIYSKGRSVVKIFPGDKLHQTLVNYPDISLKVISSLINRLSAADHKLSSVHEEE